MNRVITIILILISFAAAEGVALGQYTVDVHISGAGQITTGGSQQVFDLSNGGTPGPDGEPRTVPVVVHNNSGFAVNCMVGGGALTWGDSLTLQPHSSVSLLAQWTPWFPELKVFYHSGTSNYQWNETATNSWKLDVYGTGSHSIDTSSAGVGSASFGSVDLFVWYNYTPVIVDSAYYYGVFNGQFTLSTASQGSVGSLSCTYSIPTIHLYTNGVPGSGRGVPDELTVKCAIVDEIVGPGSHVQFRIGGVIVDEGYTAGGSSVAQSFSDVRAPTDEVQNLEDIEVDLLVDGVVWARGRTPSPFPDQKYTLDFGTFRITRCTICTDKGCVPGRMTSKTRVP